MECGLDAGIEVAWQMLVDGKSLACIDWTSVAMGVLGGCGGGGIGKLAKLLKKIFGNCNSFTTDTLVHTKNGLKPIFEIQVGDKVLSYGGGTETTLYTTSHGSHSKRTALPTHQTNARLW